MIRSVVVFHLLNKIQRTFFSFEQTIMLFMRGHHVCYRTANPCPVFREWTQQPCRLCHGVVLTSAAQSSGSDAWNQPFVVLKYTCKMLWAWAVCDGTNKGQSHLEHPFLCPGGWCILNYLGILYHRVGQEHGSCCASQCYWKLSSITSADMGSVSNITREAISKKE